MSNFEKLFIGAVGGLSATLVKFLGQDYATVVANVANLTADQVLEYKIAYGILTPILMFLGAVVAWVSEEEKRMKLIAVAIAAPALITTWSGGVKSDIVASMNLEVISSAYAEETVQSQQQEVITDEITEKPISERIKNSIGVFFGYGKEPARYWVIVGSYENKEDAKKHTERINLENSDFNAWIGVKVPPNKYYPVIVGGYNFLSEAKALKERAVALDAITEAYLSSGAQR